jgi:hypothetical protein
MDNTKEMLFQMQRFQMLSHFVNPHVKRNISDSYAFAWSDKVFPFLDESADWHKPYAEMFNVQEEQLDDLHKLLADHWEQKKPLSFYDLEDHYVRRSGAIWDRMKLWSACRYIYLHDHFDNQFWGVLLENGKCPSEAHSITKPFAVTDVYFL